MHLALAQHCPESCRLGPAYHLLAPASSALIFGLTLLSQLLWLAFALWLSFPNFLRLEDSRASCRILYQSAILNWNFQVDHASQSWRKLSTTWNGASVPKSQRWRWWSLVVLNSGFWKLVDFFQTVDAVLLMLLIEHRHHIYFRFGSVGVITPLVWISLDNLTWLNND